MNNYVAKNFRKFKINQYLQLQEVVVEEVELMKLLELVEVVLVVELVVELVVVVVVDDDVSTEPVAVGVVVGVGVEGETGSIVESSITPSEITTESFEVIDENNQSPSKIVDEKNQLNSLLSPSLNQDNSLNTIENMQKQLIKQQQIIEQLSNYLTSNGFSVSDILSTLNNSTNHLDEVENDS
mmetsp:Transcript_13538/g.14065  ORF Transcript_13538/g.14065 Transcript_13538/m.14065 type:complete len:183 (+) Transcript_13538:134-682(+)